MCMYEQSMYLVLNTPLFISCFCICGLYLKESVVVLHRPNLSCTVQLSCTRAISIIRACHSLVYHVYLLGAHLVPILESHKAVCMSVHMYTCMLP